MYIMNELSTVEEKLSKKDLALKTAGATRELAYKTLVEACQATIIKYDRDGEYLGEQADYATRVKAAESISRLNGDLREQVMVGANVTVINIGSDALQGLMIMVKDVAEQLSALRTSGQQTGEIIDIQNETT